MSAKEMNNTQAQIDTHYWGYREIDACELLHVGGGDGWGGWGNESAYSHTGGEAASPDALAQLAEQEQASLGCNLFGATVGGIAGLATRNGGFGTAVGIVATDFCERVTADAGGANGGYAAAGSYGNDMSN